MFGVRENAGLMKVRGQEIFGVLMFLSFFSFFTVTVVATRKRLNNKPITLASALPWCGGYVSFEQGSCERETNSVSRIMER